MKRSEKAAFRAVALGAFVTGIIAAGLYWFGVPTTWHVYAFVFAIGTATGYPLALAEQIADKD